MMTGFPGLPGSGKARVAVLNTCYTNFVPSAQSHIKWKKNNQPKNCIMYYFTKNSYLLVPSLKCHLSMNHQVSLSVLFTYSSCIWFSGLPPATCLTLTHTHTHSYMFCYMCLFSSSGGESIQSGISCNDSGNRGDIRINSFCRSVPSF